jgi:hypothetical protein
LRFTLETATGYSGETQKELRAVPPDGFYDFVWPASTEAFTVYNNSASMVGKVDDPDLRSLIIQTYAQAKGLIYSFQLNNNLVSEYKQLRTLYYQPDRNDILSHRERSLIDYAAKLKGRDEMVSKSVGELFSCIDQWLESKPAIQPGRAR